MPPDLPGWRGQSPRVARCAINCFMTQQNNFHKDPTNEKFLPPGLLVHCYEKGPFWTVSSVPHPTQAMEVVLADVGLRGVENATDCNMCRISNCFSFFFCKDGSDRLMKPASYSCCIFCLRCACMLLTWSNRRCRMSCLPFVWHFFSIVTWQASSGKVLDRKVWGWNAHSSKTGVLQLWHDMRARTHVHAHAHTPGTHCHPKNLLLPKPGTYLGINCAWATPPVNGMTQKNKSMSMSKLVGCEWATCMIQGCKALLQTYFKHGWLALQLSVPFTTVPQSQILTLCRCSCLSLMLTIPGVESQQ